MEPDDSRSGTPGAKEPYEKPEIVTIDLKADQVLAVGCKSTTSGSAVTHSPCVDASPCSEVGS